MNRTSLNVPREEVASASAHTLTLPPKAMPTSAIAGSPCERESRLVSWSARLFESGTLPPPSLRWCLSFIGEQARSYLRHGVQGLAYASSHNFAIWLFAHRLLKLVRVGGWLGREDSNLRMPESKSGALPLGDAPTGPWSIGLPSGRLRHPARLRTVYSGATAFACGRKRRLVGERGFEPPAPTSRTWCSTRLSYSP